ncbi:MAG: C39 family peptidase [Verrucomicrobiota bacterium]|jgi:hypothetical protein
MKFNVVGATQSPPRRGTGQFWKRRIPFLIILAGLGIAAWQLRDRNSSPIAARGGEPFQNFAAIETPIFVQNDDRWKNEIIGGTGERLGDVGCAVCSLAMALDHFGLHYTPKELNDRLKSSRAYTWRGWVKWQAVSTITDNKIKVEAVAKPSHADIDTALRSGYPVVAKLFINGTIPHWVLIVGKKGTEYLMRDPLGDGRALEPVSKYDSDIFGVRIVKPASPF